MAEYKRFLSYIFRYDEDEKKENCGFAKVEVRQGIQRIHLNLRLRLKEDMQPAQIMYVSGFYRKGEKLGSVLLGRMMVRGSSGVFNYANSSTYLSGSRVSLDKLSGLIVTGQNVQHKSYATVWDDGSFGMSMFHEDEEENKEDKEEEETQPAATQIEAEPAENQEWKALSERYPHIETLPGDNYVCLKAMPADIGRLPRSNWIFGNNGFLMYSYVKYRYIVFARIKRDQYELWVPGNYGRNEEIMAQMFGFSRFRSSKSRNASSGDFGYWCVPITFPEDGQEEAQQCQQAKKGHG